MKPELFAVDLILLCLSCGASALATTFPAVSTFLPAANFTNAGAARSHGTDVTTISKTRRKRYISQNDMLAILDYHNKVRGKVFPPASNMEYMVSESLQLNSFCLCFICLMNVYIFTLSVCYYWIDVPYTSSDVLLLCACSGSDQVHAASPIVWHRKWWKIQFFGKEIKWQNFCLHIQFMSRLHCRRPPQ